MKNLVCRLLYSIGTPRVFVWKILTKTVAFLGTLVTLFEILNTFYKDNYHFELLVKYFWAFLLGFVLLSILLSINWTGKKVFKIKDTDVSITIKVGNINKSKCSHVISTNTSFITVRDGDFISGNSVQGDFEDRFFNGNLKSLNTLISNSLKNKTVKRTFKYEIGEYPVYEVGEISKIIFKKKHVYFLALNDVNEEGQNSSRDISDFYKALTSLWNYIESFGHTEDLAIPLIASGRAGINITKEKCLFDIVDTFISKTINSKIVTNLIIYIYPGDLLNINYSRIVEYISYKTKYLRESKVSIPIPPDELGNVDD